MSVPTFIKKFKNALCEKPINQIPIKLGRTYINGVRGILTTTIIKYNSNSINLLNRDLEFTLPLRKQKLEISIQLYENNRNHYRLFVYCKNGMLFSMNLSTLRKKEIVQNVLPLRQTISLTAPRAISSSERRKRRDELVEHLSSIGMEFDKNRVWLGDFDIRNGVFVDTSSQVFLRHLIILSVIKGHYMANKGYKLENLPKISGSINSIGNRNNQYKRYIPLGLRYQILERDDHKCVSCGKNPKEDFIKLHIDHRIPFSEGGSSTYENLQTLCEECNIGKSNR